MSATPMPPRFELQSPRGRRRAWAHLLWTDHGVLREIYQNFHWLSPEMARSNQPSPTQIHAYAKAGLRSIINLRGEDDSGVYLLEREACAAVGIDLINFRVKSREAPARDVVLGARAVFERLRYPALLHCKSGADRAGIMSALYCHFRRAQPIEQAMQQLSLRYGHVRQGKTGVLDFFFAEAIGECARHGISFTQWVETLYDSRATNARFVSQWWANVLVDKVLRRE